MSVAAGESPTAGIDDVAESVAELKTYVDRLWYEAIDREDVASAQRLVAVSRALERAQRRMGQSHVVG